MRCKREGKSVRCKACIYPQKSKLVIIFVYTNDGTKTDAQDPFVLFVFFFSFFTFLVVTSSVTQRKEQKTQWASSNYGDDNKKKCWYSSIFSQMKENDKREQNVKSIA